MRDYEKSKSEKIIFRMTPPERRALQLYAYSSGCTLTDIIRNSLSKDERFQELVAEERVDFMPAQSSNVVPVRRWLQR